MSGLTAGLLLALVSTLSAAFTHAFLKLGQDRLAVQAWIRLIGLAPALPLAVWIGPPPRVLLPWILSAAAIHALYQVMLSWSYSLSDFSVAYPLARGGTPISTTILGITVLGDRMSPVMLLGVMVIGVGILLLAHHGRISHRGMFAAAATALLTTAYTVVDAHGIRLAAQPLMFIAWFYAADSVAMPVLLLVRARGGALAALGAEWQNGWKAGVLALLSFAPALFAFKLAPVGAVSALRECSVLIALALGGAMLKERLDGHRMLAAVLIVTGSVAIVAQAL